MSLSDCAHCWDTPCTCGHEYRNWSTQSLQKQIDMLKGVIGTKISETSPKKYSFNQFMSYLKYREGVKKSSIEHYAEYEHPTKKGKYDLPLYLTEEELFEDYINSIT